MDHLNLLQSDSAEARAASILHGLGFSDTDLKLPVQHFSGGWRMRLALAGALFQQSDILLLDEPTNHLDLEAVLWLQEFLRKYTGTLLIISHDQDLLNNLCTHVFTHFKLTLQIVHDKPPFQIPDGVWVKPKDFNKYPFSTLMKKVIKGDCVPNLV